MRCRCRVKYAKGEYGHAIDPIRQVADCVSVPDRSRRVSNGGAWHFLTVDPRVLVSVFDLARRYRVVHNDEATQHQQDRVRRTPRLDKGDLKM